MSQNQGFLAAKIKNHQNPNKWQIHNKYSHNSYEIIFHYIEKSAQKNLFNQLNLIIKNHNLLFIKSKTKNFMIMEIFRSK